MHQDRSKTISHCNHLVIVAVWWEYMQQYMAAKLLCQEWSFAEVVERQGLKHVTWSSWSSFFFQCCKPHSRVAEIPKFPLQKKDWPGLLISSYDELRIKLDGLIEGEMKDGVTDKQHGTTEDINRQQEQQLQYILIYITQHAIPRDFCFTFKGPTPPHVHHTNSHHQGSREGVSAMLLTSGGLLTQAKGWTYDVLKEKLELYSHFDIYNRWWFQMLLISPPLKLTAKVKKHLKKYLKSMDVLGIHIWFVSISFWVGHPRPIFPVEVDDAPWDEEERKREETMEDGKTARLFVYGCFQK